MGKTVIRPEGFDGVPYTFIENGRCIVTGRTEESFLEEGFLVLTNEEFNVLCKKWADEKSKNWVEITETQYNDCLNELPPLKWMNGGFFTSEMYCYDLGAFFQEYGGRYFKSYQHIGAARQDILSSLNQWLSKEVAA